MTLLSEVRLDNSPVLDFNIQADVWTGTRAEIRVDADFAHYSPHQRAELTNVVDRYPEWVMRLIAMFRPGARPTKVTYRLPMVVDYVTRAGGDIVRVGLIDERTYLARSGIPPEVP